MWSSLLALDEGTSRAYTVNSLDGSMTSVDLDRLSVVWKVSVGREPRALAVDPRGERAYVASAADGVVSAVDLQTGSILATVSPGFEPSGLVTSPDGRRLFVALSGGATIEVLDTDSLEMLTSIPVEADPRGLAVSGDGERLYVSHFVTGRVSVVDTAALEVRSVISTGSESSVAPNVAVHPLGGRAYVPHSRSRVSNDRLQFDTTIAPLVSVVDLDSEELLRPELLTLDTIDQPVNMPFAVDFSADGKLLYVVNAGSNDVSIVDLTTGLGRGHIEVGDNPRAIAIRDDEATALVLNALGEELAVVDLWEQTVVERIRVATADLPEEVRRGQLLFFSADRPELARDQWISCASCHLDGGHDGRTWLMDDGPRNTPPIAGLADTPPYHWSGDRTDLFDFQRTILELQGGEGLSDEENANLAAFLAYAPIEDAPKGSRGLLEVIALARGQVVFEGSGCGRCHSGPAMTDLQVHDVGSGDGAAERRGPAFDTPTLLGLASTAPYLHDGSADTLSALFTDRNPDDRHGRTSGLSSGELADLVAYLRSLP